jgi:S1-C subfamily serine protease
MKSLIAAAFILFSSFAYAEDYSALYKNAVEATVVVSVSGGNVDKDGKTKGGLGTGFFIDERYIITAEHVVSILNATEDTKVMVYGNDRPSIGTTVKTVYRDKVNDLAILEMAPVDWNNFKNIENPRTLKIAGSEPIPGESIWAIGNRHSFAFHFYAGNMSMPNVYSPDESLVHFVDVEFFKGDSGGPLMNLNGDVIGVARQMLNPGGEDYASDNLEMITASSLIRKTVNDFVLKGLSLRFDGLDKIIFGYDIDGEIFIDKITGDNKFTAYYDLKEGDREFKMNGESIHTIDNLKGRLTKVAFGDTLTVEWMRDGKIMSKAFTFKP